IRSIPTLLFTKDGEVVHQLVGVQTKVALKEQLNKLLG
ncbi:thioredoxin, partial [Helicobacter pylori]